MIQIWGGPKLIQLGRPAWRKEYKIINTEFRHRSYLFRMTRIITRSYEDIIKLMVMVNFIHQLDWLRESQIAGKILFLGVTWRFFPEEISIWIVELCKADSPPDVGGHHSTHREPEQNKSVEEGWMHALSAWAETWVSCPGAWQSWFSCFWMLVWTYTPVPPSS